jgi:small subunit ribosomal protein S17
MTVSASKKETIKPVAKKLRFHGIVVSDKNDKTIVVKVETVKKHPKYHKRYIVSHKYKVHDEKNEYRVDDKVTFIECRPLSRDKRWRVIK